MRRFCIGIALSLFLLFTFNLAFAAETTLYGPETFNLARGITYPAGEFSGIPGEATLIIDNGNLDDSARCKGVIYINGEGFLFFETDYHLEIPINIAEHNSINFRFKGLNGSKVIIRINQEEPFHSFLYELIGPDGGEIEGPIGTEYEGFKLYVPPGAFSEYHGVYINLADPFEFQEALFQTPMGSDLVGSVFEINCDAELFDLIYLTVPFDPALVTDPERLLIMSQMDTGEFDIPTGGDEDEGPYIDIDYNTNTVSVWMDHFTQNGAVILKSAYSLSGPKDLTKNRGCDCGKELHPYIVHRNDENSRPEMENIRGVVIHSTLGSNIHSAINTALDGDFAHYYIARNGDLFQVAPEETKASHVGALGGIYNDSYIGIELVQPGHRDREGIENPPFSCKTDLPDGEPAITNAQITALRQLLRGIQNRHGVDNDGDGIKDYIEILHHKDIQTEFECCCSKYENIGGIIICESYIPDLCCYAGPKPISRFNACRKADDNAGNNLCTVEVCNKKKCIVKCDPIDFTWTEEIKPCCKLVVEAAFDTCSWASSEDDPDIVPEQCFVPETDVPVNYTVRAGFSDENGNFEYREGINISMNSSYITGTTDGNGSLSTTVTIPETYPLSIIDVVAYRGSEYAHVRTRAISKDICDEHPSSVKNGPYFSINQFPPYGTAEANATFDIGIGSVSVTGSANAFSDCINNSLRGYDTSAMAHGNGGWIDRFLIIPNDFRDFDTLGGRSLSTGIRYTTSASSDADSTGNNSWANSSSFFSATGSDIAIVNPESPMPEGFNLFTTWIADCDPPCEPDVSYTADSAWAHYGVLSALGKVNYIVDNYQFNIYVRAYPDVANNSCNSVSGNASLNYKRTTSIFDMKIRDDVTNEYVPLSNYSIFSCSGKFDISR